MKEKVLVIENQSYVSGRLKSWLSSHGYEFEAHFDTKNLEITPAFLQSNQFKLIVHISNSPSQFAASLMGVVETDFPIPIIHVMEKRFSIRKSGCVRRTTSG